MKKLVMKIFSHKIIRYTMIGWLCSLLDLALLYGFTEFLWIHYILSCILAFVIGAPLGFLAQKYITFQNHSKKHLLQLFLFALFQLMGLWINVVLLWIFATKLWIHYMIVAFVAKFIVFARNYLMNHFYNFWRRL